MSCTRVTRCVERAESSWQEAAVSSLLAAILAAYGHGAGHVFNLGHGITPGVDPDHVTAFVDAVQDLSPQYHNGD